MEIALKRQLRTHTLDWDAIYRKFVGKVFNFFRYRLGDDAIAEDLTSQTFEKAWKRRQQFRGTDEQLPAWLFTIARNVLRDHLRRKKTTITLEAAINQAGDEYPEIQVEKKMAFAKLVILINQLPERQRELVTLKFGAELTNREIAQLTKLSESNVGTILHRAVTKLREQMGVAS